MYVCVHAYVQYMCIVSESIPLSIRILCYLMSINAYLR